MIAFWSLPSIDMSKPACFKGPLKGEKYNKNEIFFYTLYNTFP
jgi:hypothetical protein